MDVTDLTQQLPPHLRDIALQTLLLVVVIIIVFVLRRIITRLILGPVVRMTKRSNTDLDERIMNALKGPIQLLVIAIGILLAVNLMDFGDGIRRLSDQLARSFITAALVFDVYNTIDIVAFTSFTLRRVTGISIQERLLPFMRTIFKMFILVTGSLIIMQEWGFDITGLLASFGIIGLAFSLAAQDTAANVFGFTAIVGDNPFNVGDYIVTADFDGVVEHVGVRATRVRKLNQSLVYVPNSVLTNAALTNWSRLSKRRFDFIIGLTYDTSSQQMREVVAQLREMLRGREKVEVDSVVVHFVTFSDNSLDIRIICNVFITDWNDYLAEQEQINLAIMDIVEDLGLSMAFPSRSVYIESVPKAQPKASSVRPTTNKDEPAQ